MCGLSCLLNGSLVCVRLCVGLFACAFVCVCGCLLMFVVLFACDCRELVCVCLWV